MRDFDDATILATAVRAARAGGQVALERLGDPGYLRWKGMRDAEVGAALDVQAAVIEEIRRDFPGHAILAEETSERPADDADPLWIVDPIDGSLNFLQGLPHFAVCVGFRSETIYRVGVVYDPCRDELFQGTLGKGARLNDLPIVVQQVSEGLDAYESAIVGTDWPYDGEPRTKSLQIAQVLVTHTLDLRVMGSPALGLCYVGAGRLHAYFHLDLELWDVAAAAVVLTEAGGILTNARGSSWLYANKAYLATNAVVHGEMLRNIVPILDFRVPSRDNPAVSF
jgi:myo-inositol-1(or 4)-monophosphatase